MYTYWVQDKISANVVGWAKFEIQTLNSSKSRSDFGTIREFKFVENDERNGIF